jgi:hypothetical protein
MGRFKTRNVRFGYHFCRDEPPSFDPGLWISYDLIARNERLDCATITTPSGILSDLPGSLHIVHASPAYEWFKGKLLSSEREANIEFLNWGSETVLSDTDKRFDHAIGVGHYHRASDGEPGFSRPSPEAYYLTIACTESQISGLIDAAKLNKFSLEVSLDLAGPSFGSVIGPDKWDYNANPLLLIFDVRFFFNSPVSDQE